MQFASSWSSIIFNSRFELYDTRLISCNFLFLFSNFHMKFESSGGFSVHTSYTNVKISGNLGYAMLVTNGSIYIVSEIAFPVFWELIIWFSCKGNYCGGGVLGGGVHFVVFSCFFLLVKVSVVVKVKLLNYEKTTGIWL